MAKGDSIRGRAEVESDWSGETEQGAIFQSFDGWDSPSVPLRGSRPTVIGGLGLESFPSTKPCAKLHDRLLEKNEQIIR
jgi:hypothetical protein